MVRVERFIQLNHTGETGADSVVIQSIQLSDDQKTVLLEIPELKQDLAQKTLEVLPGLPNMIETSMGLVLAIDYNLRAADGNGDETGDSQNNSSGTWRSSFREC